jgi:hypothetical protein
MCRFVVNWAEQQHSSGLPSGGSIPVDGGLLSMLYSGKCLVKVWSVCLLPARKKGSSFASSSGPEYLDCH